MSALIPRDTVRDIVAKRNERLALYAEAHTAIGVASEALARAAGTRQCREATAYTYATRREDKEFLGVIELPERAGYLEQARRLTDIDVWSNIVRMTDLERLMDKQAKDDLRRQLTENPPEVTEANVFATLEQFAADAGTIFRRGIANAFSKLDRRFRSHDGWKIGSRVVLDYCFDEWGSWSYRSNHRDALTDIERTFYVLDGRPVPQSYVGIVAQVENDRRESGRALDRRQGFTETEFFRVRSFKNGNAHVWFKRDDLVEKVNKLLGEYYGAPIPEEREARAEAGSYARRGVPARNDGFYPTPPDAVAHALRDFPLLNRADQPPLRVLEPSAGTGNLARRAARTIEQLDGWCGGRKENQHRYRFDHVVDCIELQPALAAALRHEGLYNRVTCADFLAIPTPRDPAALYDRVLMNPPFNRGEEIDHVLHALKFLKPGGRLMAILPAGLEFREDRKSTAFRALVERLGGSFRDLPEGSFASVGTYINTIVLTLRTQAHTASKEAA